MKVIELIQILQLYDANLDIEIIAGCASRGTIETVKIIGEYDEDAYCEIKAEY